MYDAGAGNVLLDGDDVRDFKLKSLRAAVIFVPQDPVLFDVTLRENLLYGNPQASDDEIERVTKLAQLDVLIDRLPKGLDESLGPQDTVLEHQVELGCPSGEVLRAWVGADKGDRTRDVVGADVCQRGRRHSSSSAATSRIAATIFGYAPQRQMLPLMNSRISSSDRARPSARSATPDII